MDWTEYAVAATVALVLAVTLVSGPLVGAVDFTPDREQQSFSPGEGTIEVTVVSVPSTVTLDRGSYGSGAYYLRVPDATVDIESISGQPMLIYKLRIPDLGYARGTTHFVDESHEGRRTVSLERATIEPGKIGREQYRGELLILVRTNGEDATNARRNVTVEVDS